MESGSLSWLRGTKDAVSGRTITLPGGKNGKLTILATAVRGHQLNQTFKVAYTDGTSDTFTLSLSDWFSPQLFSGKSIAKQMSGRLTSIGALDRQPFYLYAYSFPLDASKTVKSLSLPSNRDVIVLSADLTAAGSSPSGTATPVSLTSSDNFVGIARPGTAVPLGGLDGSGDAYDSQLLGTVLNFAGAQFNFGAPDVKDAISGVT
jgi:hypothetical protein